MPESETEHIDYYPSGWTEEIHDEYLVEWRYDNDPTIVVRLNGTMGDNVYEDLAVDTVPEDFWLTYYEQKAKQARPNEYSHAALDKLTDR